MLNPVQMSPNFGSTRIKINPEEYKKPVSNVLDKYLGPVKEHYALHAGLEGKSITPQMVADDIRIGEAAVTIKGDIINVFGKDKAADSYIGKLLTKLFPENAKFIENIK